MSIGRARRMELAAMQARMDKSLRIRRVDAGRLSDRAHPCREANEGRQSARYGLGKEISWFRRGHVRED